MICRILWMQLLTKLQKKSAIFGKRKKQENLPDLKQIYCDKLASLLKVI